MDDIGNKTAGEDFHLIINLRNRWERLLTLTRVVITLQSKQYTGELSDKILERRYNDVDIEPSYGMFCAAFVEVFTELL